MTIRREKGAPNGKWHISHSGGADRVFDVLRCDRGATHDVRHEWQTRNGIRTGGLVVYCWTCRRVVVPVIAGAETKERTNTRHRFAQQKRKAEQEQTAVRELQDTVLARRQAGELNINIAADLGMTPQRASQLAARARRRSA